MKPAGTGGYRNRWLLARPAFSLLLAHPLFPWFRAGCQISWAPFDTVLACVVASSCRPHPSDNTVLPLRVLVQGQRIQCTSMASEKEVVQEFQQRRQRLQELAAKIEDLSNQAAEHTMVIKTLEPMEASRKCFRLIGDVLVERMVGETLPAVIKNRDNLEAIAKQLTETFETQEKALAEFQKKHKIRIVNRQGQPIDEGPDEGGASGSSASKPAPSKSQGVLVK